MADVFRFKQFEVHHAKATMKVGTDAVLLGAWTELSGHEHRILDIGTGSGVIALMLAQRSTAGAHIDAIDIDRASLEEARQNFDLSPWAPRLHAIRSAVQTYASDAYDLIVSNPPYFVNSLHPPNDTRMRARHAVSLSYAELIAAVVRLLAGHGSFNVILPAPSLHQFTNIAGAAGLHCRKSCGFKTRQHKPVERYLLSFARADGPRPEETLTLYGDGTDWTAEYKALTDPFYLGSAENISR